MRETETLEPVEGGIGREWHQRHLRNATAIPGILITFSTAIFVVLLLASVSGQIDSTGNRKDGKHLFERETFGGNGRTCLTCHSRGTGTVSPQDAQRRFQINASDPLFVHDGSDDRLGHGAARMLRDATILMEILLPANVRLADDPSATSVILARGIPTTLNTPAMDPVLMLDGRQPTLELQALGAIQDHAQATVFPTSADLQRLKEFQQSDAFFSSIALRAFARGGTPPQLPLGATPAEVRGRRFFENVLDFADLKRGACAACHSGPMLNETNVVLFLLTGSPPGTRFQSVLVSELNAAQNPVREFIFNNADGTTSRVITPDPGRALITGIGQETGMFDNVNAFKIPTLWGVDRTAPYFHDNSAKTLEDVAVHYARFFEIATDVDGPGGAPPVISLSTQDLADMVAFMKLLR